MQFKKSLATLVLLGLSYHVSADDSDNSAISVLVSDYSITGVTGATATTLVSALHSVDNSIRTREEWTSIWSVIRTAVPTSVYQSLEISGYNYIQTTAEPAWFTGLPSDARSELLEEQSAQQSVINSVLSITASSSTGGASPQQTGAVMAGGAVVAGVLGMAALL